MTESLAASKKVMKNYLSELLTDDNVTPAKQKSQNKIAPVSTAIKSKNLSDLLQSVSADVVAPVNTKIANKENLIRKALVNDNVATPSLFTKKNADKIKKIAATKKTYRQGDFQAMFFSVAGLTIAVPLIELGGIHNKDNTTSIMGAPDWFKGVMLHRDEKINIVDTALWIMPEKCNEKLKSSLNYQYVIMLNDSRWGLMAEHLVDTVTLSQDDVKWLDSSSKRPWLAGLVKDRMCALLNVEELIQLFDEGSGIDQ